MANTQTGTSGGTSATRGSTTGGMQAVSGGQIPDTTYNLISVLYHTLQGCQAYEQYAQDAEQAGQQEIAEFFRKTGREFEQCAQHGQQLLAQCLQQGQGTGRTGQLNSQMSGSSGQQSQSGKSSGQQSHSGTSSGQHSQSGTSPGQQGSSRGSTNTGSSNSNISGSGSSRNKL